MDLTGKTILVTGASSGLGREISILVSELGGKLVLVGRNENELEETLKRMTGKGHIVEPFDLNDIDAIPKWLKGLCVKTGPLKGLVHSAGIANTLGINLLNQKRINAIMNINFNAAVALTKAFKQKHIAENESSVVYLASVAALKGEPGLSIYSASKGALISLCRALAIELAPFKIRVNCVVPGHILTEMGEKTSRVIPPEQFAALQNKHLLGFGSPIDVANAVAFLLSDTGKWITGTKLIVDGGYTV
jgi:NAD(P)-dependent dehydrogenase (short-subunit alcohol dehydrogenase family)